MAERHPGRTDGRARRGDRDRQPRVFHAVLAGALVVAALSVPVLASSFAYRGWQDGPWEKVDEDDGITIWINDSSPTDIDGIRAEAVIEAPADELFPIIMDHDRSARISKAKAYEVLSDDGRNLRIYQRIKHTGIGEREFTLQAKVTRPEKPNGGPYSFVYAKDPRGKDDPDVDEMEFIEGSFVLFPVDGGKRTRASYRALVDPGAWVPDMVLNRALRGNARETLQRLQRDAAKR